MRTHARAAAATKELADISELMAGDGSKKIVKLVHDAQRRTQGRNSLSSRETNEVVLWKSIRLSGPNFPKYSQQLLGHARVAKEGEHHKRIGRVGTALCKHHEQS
jgi:hypothetical protein